MRTLLIVLLTAAMSCAAFGQDAARQALAEELMKAMDIEGQMQKSIEVLKQAMPAQMEQTRKAMGVTNMPPPPSDMFSKTMDAIFSGSEWKELQGEMARIYAEVFSAEELKGITDFYKSSAGKAFLDKQPEIMRRSMEINQRMMMSVMPRIMELNKRPAGGPSPVPPPAP